jgi:hypothetical protein
MGGATAGGAGNGGSANDAYQPRCGEDVGKGDPCSPSSVQLCYKTCGPNSIGFKSETCQQGAYVEQSGCTFPDENDYSCYAIPASKPATCPAGTPRAAEDCGVAECTLCFGGGLANPTYQDSSGTQKEGYCVCTDAGEWTCASVPSWPCPGGDGCN